MTKKIVLIMERKETGSGSLHPVVMQPQKAGRGAFSAISMLPLRKRFWFPTNNSLVRNTGFLSVAVNRQTEYTIPAYVKRNEGL